MPTRTCSPSSSATVRLALEHPQLIHDGFTIDLDDAERGTVRQPAAIVKAAGTPADLTRSAPGLDADRDAILALAASSPDASGDRRGTRRPTCRSPASRSSSSRPCSPAPHGTTMLTDLGARVIKVEPLAGDRIRMILPFPESGGLKVMQGKESIAVDLTTDDGVALIRQVAATADVVVQGYRAGAMTQARPRLRVGEADQPERHLRQRAGLRRRRPVRQEAGVCAEHRRRLGHPARQRRPDGRGARRPHDRADPGRRPPAVGGECDGQRPGRRLRRARRRRRRSCSGSPLATSAPAGRSCSARCSTPVATRCRRRRSPTPGAPKEPAPDAELRGLGSLYRIYDAADGYVFLAAPTAGEWAGLADALAPYADLAGDARFADAGSAHRAHTRALIETLSSVFAQKSAAEWERELLATGVGLRRRHHRPRSRTCCSTTRSVGPVVTSPMSCTPRSTSTPGCRRTSSSRARPPRRCRAVINGEQTDAILAELGKSARRDRRPARPQGRRADMTGALDDLGGRVALVTGGGQGIGRATCVALAERGADVAFSFRRDVAEAEQTVTAIEAHGRRALAIQADMGDGDQVIGMVSARRPSSVRSRCW